MPVRVLQATLSQLDGTFTVPVAAPRTRCRRARRPTNKRGGLNVGVQPRLTGALPGLRRYFETYPFTCLEQMASKSIGLRDAKLWSTLVNALPTYLDADGLANYFPPRAEDKPNGSDRLTAYLLAAAHESGFELPAAARDQMLAGLAAFAEGRIERKFWSPRQDLDVRKLAAIEALSRYGRAQAEDAGLRQPHAQPVADRRGDRLVQHPAPRRRHSRAGEAPGRGPADPEEPPDLRRHHDEIQHRGDDFWWWLMDSADANSARLILAVLDDPRWRDDMPRMVVGSLGRQRNGAWSTTTANLWGSLALDKFSAKFESAKITGTTSASVSPRERRGLARLAPRTRAAAVA